MNETGFDEAKALIDGAKRIVISGHLSPDGDTLGSAIALARLLKAYGKEAYATADLNALGKLGFMKGVEDIIPVRKLRHQRKKFDLFICVDCRSLDRLPPEIRGVVEDLPTLVIDHHDGNAGNFGKVDISDPAASSVGEIVWRFAKWNGWELDDVAAEALWVSIVTDTGRFAYEKCSPETMLVAADLLRHNVRKELINDIIYNRFSNKAMQLKRIAWKSLHIWRSGRVAEVTLTREDFRAVRGTKADAEDAVEIPRLCQRNEVAVYFYQIPDRTKEIRCSIRTRNSWNAAELAARFGGGGHLHAAGCTIKTSMGAAKRMMRNAIKEMMKCPPKQLSLPTAKPDTKTNPEPAPAPSDSTATSV